MTRGRENNLGLCYVTVGNQELHSRDAEIGWGGGYEVRLGHMCCDCCGEAECRPHVHTIHQGQIVILERGDWILPEPDGVHFYPVKPDIFTATYEPYEP